MTDRRVGILGGTFDPIHNGHLDVARAAQAALHLTELHVMTANVPPHRRQPIASASDRFAMVNLAVNEHPGWHASDLELHAPGPSYTSETLGRFHARGYAPRELCFVIGADAFADVGTWHDYPRILDAANFAVVSRPGLSVGALPGRLPTLAARMVHVTDEPMPASAEPLIFLIDAATADVSGTAIRAACEAGEPIDALVPPDVRQYIEEHGLYGSKASRAHRTHTPSSSAAGRLHGKDR